MFVRSSEGYPTRDRRRPLVVAVAVVTVVYLFFTGLSTVWTDYLWYESVGLTQVWRVNLVVAVVLGAVGAVVVFAVVWANLLLTDRLSPRYELLAVAEDEELVERFREWVEPRLRLVRLGVAALFALLLGVGLAAWRDEVLLFFNATPFGVADPQFGNDISFYMFKLPFWSQLAGWLFNLTALTAVLVGALHYLNGGIRWRRDAGLLMSTGVKAHLSVLVALLALIRAVMYRIDAWELLFSQAGPAPGAGFTDVNARLPAFNLLALVSVAAAVLIVVNIWRHGWTMAIVSVVSWLFISVAAGLIYPAIVQRFTVNPDELNKERPYIARAIEATRTAFGLDGVEIRQFAASADLTADDLERNRLTVDNLRLWDPDVLVRTYQNLQEIRTYYRVDRVDTDRYRLDGLPTQVMVAVRELDEENLPATDWQNRRLAYTHGFGAVLSPANRVEPDGQPAFWLRDVPPVAEVESLRIDQARVYFGETYDPDSPVIVRTGTEPQEVDFPLTPTGTALNEYDGPAGVEISGVLRRLAFALRYRDLNILISGQIRADSRVLMVRNIRTRVEKVAPFLYADGDPYPILVDGEIVWMIDLYSISDRYPYSQRVSRADTLRLTLASRLPLAGWNYMRNSVKATVDSFDGTLRLYVVDPTDPIVASWRKVYPDLFLDGEQMPPEIREHLRYPQDLFKIQSEIYLDYHMDDTDVFFRRDDAWEIPEDPSTIRRLAVPDLLRGDRRSVAEVGAVQYLRKMLPYYLLMRLPGEADVSYVLLQPFNPENKRNMASFLVADSSPDRYGRLIDYRLPRESVVDGPGQVGNRIDQDPQISQQKSLWNTQGSTVLFGDMLVVPIEESVVYVQPVYLEAETGGLPEFRKAIVVFQDRVEWRDSLEEALLAVFGQATEPGEEPPPPGELPPAPQGTIAELLQQAADAFESADAALRRGDLAEYQRLVNEARSLIEEARRQLSEGTSAEIPAVWQ